MTKEDLDAKVWEQQSIIEHTENQICSYVMQYIETLPYKVGDKEVAADVMYAGLQVLFLRNIETISLAILR